MNTKGIFIDIPVELDTPRWYPPKPLLPLTPVNQATIDVKSDLPMAPSPPGAFRPLCPPYKRTTRSRHLSLTRRKGLSVLLRAHTIHVIHQNGLPIVKVEEPPVAEYWPQVAGVSSEG